MFPLLRHLIGWLISACGTRQGLMLENLALRQEIHARGTTFSGRGKSLD
jgi:hypothetical protein